MSYIILLALMIWAISSIVKSSSAKKAERERQRQIARLNAEAKQRQLEAARLREEWKQRQAEAKAEVQRMVALEEAQMRMKIAEAEAWRKQEAWNAKQEKEIAVLNERMAKAEDAIAHHSELLEMYTSQMTEAQSKLDELCTALYVVRYQIAHAQTLTEKKSAELAKQEQRIANQKRKAENDVISLKKKMFASEQKIKEAERKLA